MVHCDVGDGVLLCCRWCIVMFLVVYYNVVEGVL